jgi:hypothetical protein
MKYDNNNIIIASRAYFQQTGVTINHMKIHGFNPEITGCCEVPLEHIILSF